MEKARVALGIIVIVIIAAVYFFVPSTKDAVKYNDKIVNLQEKVVKAMMAIFETEDDAEIARRHAHAIATVEDAVKTLKAMKPYKDNTQLRDTAVKVFEFYESICQNEYREMIEIKKKGGEPSPEDQARMEQLLTGIEDRESALDAEMSAVQREFASKHGCELVQSNWEQEMQGK